MITVNISPDVSLVFTDSSIKTIRYALQYMIGLNESIKQYSGSKVLKEAAIVEGEKCKVALSDFEHFFKVLSENKMLRGLE